MIKHNNNAIKTSNQRITDKEMKNKNCLQHYSWNIGEYNETRKKLLIRVYFSGGYNRTLNEKSPISVERRF